MALELGDPILPVSVVGGVFPLVAGAQIMFGAGEVNYLFNSGDSGTSADTTMLREVAPGPAENLGKHVRYTDTATHAGPALDGYVIASLMIRVGATMQAAVLVQCEQARYLALFSQVTEVVG